MLRRFSFFYIFVSFVNFVLIFLYIFLLSEQLLYVYRHLLYVYSFTYQNWNQPRPVDIYLSRPCDTYLLTHFIRLYPSLSQLHLGWVSDNYLNAHVHFMIFINILNWNWKLILTEKDFDQGDCARTPIFQKWSTA